MHIYRFSQQQDFPVSRQRLWEYLAAPSNLDDITPPQLAFRIVHGATTPISRGQLIEYRIRLPLLGWQSWLTEITSCEPGEQFVDEQRLGPYAFWHHRHRLEDRDAGCRMHDLVTYALPFGPLGRLAHVVFVRRQLEAIFAHRHQILAERFGEPHAGPPSTTQEKRA